MGNDGGSIPKRRELVKEATRAQTASEAKESVQEQQEYCWTTCPLSQQPLKEPVVSDWAGNLYNKDAVIEFLLPSEDEGIEAAKADKAKLLDGRIRSLKDVQEVKFHIEDSDASRAQTGAHFERRWSCPITNKALGPGVKAVYLVPCGHAFEEAAIRNVTEGRCLQCEEPFETDNVISILPLSKTEKDRLMARVRELKDRGLSHSLRKSSSKKRKKGQNAEADPQLVDNKRAKPVQPGIKNADTASVTAKVQAELAEMSKRRRVDDNIGGLYSKTQRGPVRDGDFMTRGFTMSASGGNK